MTTTHKTTTQAPQTAPVTSSHKPVTTKLRRTRAPKSAANNPDHTIPAYASLSFVRGGIGRFGWTSTDLFAVPDEEHGDGWMTGLRAFQELQQFIQTQPQDPREIGLAHFVQWVLEEAFKLCDTAKVGVKSKRGAACAFTHCAGRFLLSSLRADTGRYMAATIATNQTQRDLISAHDAKKRAAFVERMRAARAAKRVARQSVETVQPPEKTSFSEVGEGVAA